jgi:hypothetical protein
MTDIRHDEAQASGPRMDQPPSGAGAAREMPSRWSGWVVFAAAMLILVGLYQAIEGLVALINRNFYLVGSEGLVVNVNFTAWGIVHLVVGVVAILAGFGVLAGKEAARIAGIVLAALSAFVNLAFIAAYPLWVLIIIVLDIIVIYALAVHGREVTT